MLISESKKFIYYHTYKVAGTSIRSNLIPYCSKKQVIYQFLFHVMQKTKISFNAPAIYRYHPRLSDVKSSMGDKFYSYFRFTFVREPLDWQKSLYTYMKKNNFHPQHKIVKNLSFNEYLKWRLSEEVKLASDFIYDENGCCLVEKIYKYEDLDNDFSDLCSRLSISAQLQKKNSSRSNECFEVDTCVLAEFEEKYSLDYERFGYKKSCDSLEVLEEKN